MNQEKSERRHCFQELGHIKHNENFKNQNEKIFLERCKFKFKKNSSCQPASNRRPVFKFQVVKAEDIGELGLFQINLNHVC